MEFGNEETGSFARRTEEVAEERGSFSGVSHGGSEEGCGRKGTTVIDRRYKGRVAD